MANNFLSTSEVARLLGISRIAVFKRIKSGNIKAIKVGRNFIIEKDDLTQILGSTLTNETKKELEKAVIKTVGEYGEALRLLGKE
jgi:excisionase family DNA binding protein